MRIIINCIGVLSLFAAIDLTMSGCGGRRSEALPAALADSIPINIPQSTFNLPVTYSIRSLESFLNQKIQRDFLETIITPEGKEKLEIKVEMTKVKKITLETHGRELVCRVPLRAVATILHSGVNIITKGIKPVETEVILELRTPASLDSRWRLVTKFDLVKTSWVTPPKLTLVGIHFDLTHKLEKFLADKEQELTSLLDREINKGVSLEKPVNKVWTDLQRPIPLFKKPAQAYLKFICESISGHFSLGDTSIVCMTSIKARVLMLTDTTKYKTVLKLPSFRHSEDFNAYSDVYLYVYLGFEDINHELTSLLKGHSFSTSNMSMTIIDVGVYAAEAGLVIRLASTGDIDGELIASGKPTFDSLTQTFSFSEFDFTINSTSTLLRAGDAILHDMVRDTIQSLLALQMDSLFLKVPMIIEGAVAKGKTGQTIDVHVGDFRVSSCAINMGSKRIHFIAHTTFMGGLNLKKLSPGKSLHIVPKK